MTEENNQAALSSNEATKKMQSINLVKSQDLVSGKIEPYNKTIQKMINFDGVIKVGTKKHNSTRPNIILEY